MESFPPKLGSECEHRGRQVDYADPALRRRSGQPVPGRPMVALRGFGVAPEEPGEEPINRVDNELGGRQRRRRVDRDSREDRVNQDFFPPHGKELSLPRGNPAGNFLDQGLKEYRAPPAIAQTTAQIVKREGFRSKTQVSLRIPGIRFRRTPRVEGRRFPSVDG
ncbi:hypothetical protein HPP92_020465 [Vanilla planifolia]|uniref:Uncharacterized protein n=1 Tax=Vanilla planifolia TaxID=51239 RepID=A0A835UM36_VANPL|nr:hypothetical protein HPP92_020465 [Vanilla planifolia]